MKALTFLEWQKQKLFDIYHNGAECREIFNNDTEMLNNYIKDCNKSNKVANFYSQSFDPHEITTYFNIEPYKVTRYVNRDKTERLRIDNTWINILAGTIDEFLYLNKKVDFEWKPEIENKYFK